MRLVDELRDLVVEAREVANNDSVLDALRIKGIIKEPIPNQDRPLTNEQHLMHLHELVLNNTTAVLTVLPWLQTPDQLDQKHPVLGIIDP